MLPSSPQPPRLLDRLRDAARLHGHSAPTVEALAARARDFILFHGKKHPSPLGLPHVTRFLEHAAPPGRKR